MAFKTGRRTPRRSARHAAGLGTRKEPVDILCLDGMGARKVLTMATNSKLLLSPKEAAEFLGLPEGTLAQWRSQRRGPPYIKLEERLVRYRRSDLEEYLSGHLVDTGELGDVPIAVRVTGR